MTTKPTKQRLFDMIEYETKVLDSLKKLADTKKPGEKSGAGGKVDILNMNRVKDEIKRLIEQGYTAKQIAAAISDDVFGILPKTITQIVSNKHLAKKEHAISKSKKPRKQMPENTHKDQVTRPDNTDKNHNNPKKRFAIEDVE